MPKELSNHINTTLNDLARDKMARNPFNGRETYYNIRDGEEAEKETRDTKELDDIWKRETEEAREAKQDSGQTQQTQQAQGDGSGDKMQE